MDPDDVEAVLGELSGDLWDVHALGLGAGVGGRPRAERGERSTRVRADALDGTMHVATGREHVLHVEMHDLSFDVICSPVDVEAFLIGHLIAEGFADGLDGIVRYELVRTEQGTQAEVELGAWRPVFQRRNLNVTWTECGSSAELLKRRQDRLDPLPLDWTVDAPWMKGAVQAYTDAMSPWGGVGGIHQVALLHHGAPDVLIHAIDVGRHNALDRAIGRAVLDGHDPRQLVALTTGRVSSDIVLKAHRVGLPLIGTLNAALDSAVRLARHVELGVVCYLKRRPALVIAGAERLGLAPLRSATSFAEDEPPMG